MICATYNTSQGRRTGKLLITNNKTIVVQEVVKINRSLISGIGHRVLNKEHKLHIVKQQIQIYPENCIPVFD